jgi:hypothetical protein
MSHVTSWSSPICQGGRDTGPVVGGVQTLLIPPRWLRFLRPNVFVTVTGLDDVEAWVPGARTLAQAHAVHDALVAKYRKKARALAMANRGRRTA